jgi:hypothetical protein
MLGLAVGANIQAALLEQQGDTVKGVPEVTSFSESNVNPMAP